MSLCEGTAYGFPRLKSESNFVRSLGFGFVADLVGVLDAESFMPADLIRGADEAGCTGEARLVNQIHHRLTFVQLQCAGRQVSGRVGLSVDVVDHQDARLITLALRTLSTGTAGLTTVALVTLIAFPASSGDFVRATACGRLRHRCRIDHDLQVYDIALAFLGVERKASVYRRQLQPVVLPAQPLLDLRRHVHGIESIGLLDRPLPHRRVARRPRVERYVAFPTRCSSPGEHVGRQRGQVEPHQRGLSVANQQFAVGP